MGGFVKYFRGRDWAVMLALLAVFCLFDWAPDSDLVRAGQERGLFLVAGLVAFTMLKRVLTAPYAAFLSLFGVMWVLHGYQPNGTEHLVHLVAVSLAAVWLSQYPDKVTKWLSVFGLGEALFGLAQFFGWNPYGYELPWYLNKPSGTFGQETILGAFLASSLAPALFSKRYWAVLPIFLCCLATKSTMTVASSGAVVGLWAIAEFGFIPISIISAGFFIAIGIFLHLHPDSEWGNFNGRILFWKYAWDKFLLRPVFGFGPGSWLPEAPTFELRLTHVHNEFLEFLTEYGSLGALTALWGVWVFVRSWRPTWYHAVVVALLIDSCGNFPLHIASTGLIFLTGYLLSVRGPATVLHWRRN